MKFTGKDPNGINQISQSLLSIDVNGVEQVTVSTESVDINTKLTVEGSISASQITASGAGLYDIPSEALTADAASKILSGSVSASISPNKGLKINSKTEVSGALYVSESVVIGGTFFGDASGLTNIPADALGDLNQLKSGS